jgi:uncharacterized protein with HEPN domain
MTKKEQRSWTLYLGDMIVSMGKIEAYIAGISYETFEKTDIIIDAVVRNLEIIGEAASHIPEEIRQDDSRIPWRKIIGLRNIAIHEYFHVDLPTVWQIVREQLPATKIRLQEMATGK